MGNIFAGECCLDRKMLALSRKSMGCFSDVRKGLSAYESTP